MPPLSERARSELNCSNCFKSALDTKLRVCAACKLTRYCTSECQKIHWEKHKPICKSTKKGQALIEKMEKDGFKVNGLSPVDVDRKFRKWHVAAQPTIDRYLIAAMDFMKHPDRCFTHIVVITVKCNLSPKNMTAMTQSDVIQQFLIDYAYMCRIDEMPSNVGLEGCRDMAVAELDKMKKARKDGTAFGTAFAIVRFPVLKINQLTYLFLNNHFDPSLEPKVVDWVAELKENIRTGTIL